MSSRFALIGSICLLLFAGLCAGWGAVRTLLAPVDPGGLRLEAPARVQGALGRPLTVEVTGQGVGAGIRAWLVPELTHRQAVVGSVKTWGTPLDMVRQGRFGYLANGLGGFMVVDLENPRRPEVLASVDTPGQAFALASAWDFVYMADGQGGLQVFAVADPAAPQLVTTLATKGATLGVATLPGLVLLADGSSGLQVLDAADPGWPVPLGALSLPGFARSVAAEAGHAYVALGEYGMAVVDLAEPQRPREVLRLAAEGTVAHVATAEGLLLAALRPLSRTSPWVLQLFDLTAPGSPALVGEFPLVGHPVGISFDGQRAAVALSTDGLQVVDFSDPAQPRQQRSLDFSATVRCAILAGDMLWVGNGTSRELLAVDLKREVRLAASSLSVPATVRTLKMLPGNRMLLSVSGKGVEIYDVADPRRPQRLGVVPVGGEVWQVASRGSLLFLGAAVQQGGTKGLLMVADIADPRNPVILSRLDLPLIPRPIVAAGDCLALGLQSFGAHPPEDAEQEEGQDRLCLVDVSDPGRPRMRGSLGLAAGVKALAARGTQLFVHQKNSEFRIFDISDPDHLRPLGAVMLPWLQQTAGGVHATIELQGGLALLSDGLGGVKVIDISRLFQPRFLGVHVAGENVMGMVLEGETLYVSLQGQGLVTADFSEPKLARTIGTLPLPAKGRSPAVAEGHLWLVDPRGCMGVQIAPKPIEVEAIPHADGAGLTLRLPSPSMPGDYTLWIEQGGERVELPGCVSFREV